MLGMPENTGNFPAGFNCSLNPVQCVVASDLVQTQPCFILGATLLPRAHHFISLAVSRGHNQI